MQFALTDEEEMIRDTARRIAADPAGAARGALDRGEGGRSSSTTCASSAGRAS